MAEKKGKHNHTIITSPYRSVSEATQHQAETRDPPARIPERASHQGITTHNLHFVLATVASNDNAVYSSN